jgi:ribosomal protein S27AE
MTVREVSTISCDACGAARSSISARFASRIPDGWAEINVDYHDMADEKTVYEEWHLCPDCTGSLLAAVVSKREPEPAP